MKNETIKVRLAPKALFLLGLGSSTDKNIELSHNIYDKVYSFMDRSNCAIMIINGRLDFIPIQKEKPVELVV